MDRKLLRIKVETFQARGTWGSLYMVERIDNVLEERQGDSILHTPKHPEYRLSGSHRAVNRNPDHTFTIVGTGEVLRRLSAGELVH